MNNRNLNVPILDSLRAFAALSVCLFHFVCTTTDYIKTQWILDIFSVGSYGVQLFFVISGFVIPWSMYNANFKINHFFKFALKRFSRLEPPYIASLFFAIFILTMDKKHRFQPQIVAKYQKTVAILKSVSRVEDLFPYNSLRYEVLKGDKKGIKSVRINDQFRIEFTTTQAVAETVVTICNIIELSKHYK
jgi:proteic killer suppression protein